MLLPYLNKDLIEAGCDETGRGCLAGAVYAASILAKTYRDDYMNRFHEEYPYYDWNHNKGYPTMKHRSTIAERNTTPYN